MKGQSQTKLYRKWLQITGPWKQVNNLEQSFQTNHDKVLWLLPLKFYSGLDIEEMNWQHISLLIIEPFSLEQY